MLTALLDRSQRKAFRNLRTVLEAIIFMLVRNNIIEFGSLFSFKYVLVEYFTGIVPDIHCFNINTITSYSP